MGATANDSTAMGPTAVAQRIVVLDVLRGFAVLGILVMNIQSFAMVDPAYFNPTTALDLTGVNLAVWWFSHVFVDMKFMALFSMLFGAGIVLSCSRVEARGGRPARFHLRRTFFLLVFGVIHAYLLWVGDILVWYSLSAFIAYLLWRARPGWLVFWAVLFLGIGTLINVFFQWSLPYWPAESVEQNVAYWDPPQEILDARIEAYRGGWLEQMSERVPSAFVIHTFVYAIWGLWRTLGLMALGMALYKWDVITGRRSNGFYVRMAMIGFGLGLPTVILGALQNFTHDWVMEYSMFAGSMPNYWGSLGVAFGFVAMVMLAVRRTWMPRTQALLAPVGRMAFTSYILQTVICTTLFYGHGFGLFNHLERWQQALVIGAVWVAVIAFANLWLSRFRIGPLEWAWRTLTYGRLQPIR